MATTKITHKVRNPLKQNEGINLGTATTTATSTATGSTAATYKIQPSDNGDVSNGDVPMTQIIGSTATPGVVWLNDETGRIESLGTNSPYLYLNGQGEWTEPQGHVNITGVNNIAVQGDSVNNEGFIDHKNEIKNGDSSTNHGTPIIIHTQNHQPESFSPTPVDIVNNIISVPFISYDENGHIEYVETINYDISNAIGLTVENGVLS